MLSGETAVGAFPVRAVADTRRDHSRRGVGPFIDAGVLRRESAHDHAHALCEAAVTLAERGDAEAIVAVTRGGGTARHLSALRPRVPILATTDRAETARRLALYWGVAPVCTDIGESVDAAGTLIGRQLVARGLVRTGAVVVLVSINSDVTRTDANYLKIQPLCNAVVQTPRSSTSSSRSSPRRSSPAFSRG